jgi:hypothetical protein
MGENSEQVERYIEERRNNLSNDISELERKAKEAVDWRAQVDQRPGTMMGIAFGAGILLSAILGGGSRRSRPSKPDETSSALNAYSTESNVSNADYQAAMATAEDHHESAVSKTLENVKGALLGVALAKCEEFLEELVPGFTTQYRKAEARNKSNVPPVPGNSIN